MNLQPHQIPLVEALRTSLGIEKSAVALMIHTTGALAAVPIYGPDEKPHRWTEDEQRSYLAMFD